MKVLRIWGEEQEIHMSPEQEFLHKCPYFLKGNCASYNWGNKSPCWICNQEQNYILPHPSVHSA